MHGGIVMAVPYESNALMGPGKGIHPAAMTNRRVLNLLMMPHKCRVSCILLAVLVSVAAARSDHVDSQQEKNRVSQNNVVWDSPSEDYNGSMPIGNGDLAANVWVEPDGDPSSPDGYAGASLLFYISKSDAWSGDQQLLKIGRVRVKLDPPLYVDGATFKQELDLSTGSIRIEAASDLRSLTSNLRTISFWVDANRPVINLEISSDEEFRAEVVLEPWRTPDGMLWGGAEPDTILPARGDSIRWFQRNVRSIFRETLENQHLGHLVDQYPDPLLGLTFGAQVLGDGLESKNATTLVTSEPLKTCHLRVHALTAQTDTPEAWVRGLEQQQEDVVSVSREDAWTAHVDWWKAFWDRSYIRLSGTPEAEEADRAYQLQRWVSACAGRGAYPIKFNGSLFTVDGVADYHEVPEGRCHGPDYRRWGGCYWFQNTRHSYWPMLYCGDYDMMKPLFVMYRKMLPLMRDRTRHYFDHEGVYFSETLHPWGLNPNRDFGIGNEDFYPKNTYVRYYWSGGNELSKMMLEYFDHTGDEQFARDTLVPIADEVVTHFDQHYPRGKNGKLHIEPAQSLETWHTAVDPLPIIVGLQTVLGGLLELPEALTSSEQRVRWSRLLGELPDVPMGEADGKRWLEPAVTYTDKANVESPQLYAVFPFNAYALGKPGMQIALETYERRLHKATGCWRYDGILAAMLGLTNDAKGYLLTNIQEKFHTVHPSEKDNARPSRFPAFWHTGDWVPDQDHASIILTTLQRMLMLTDGRAIRLLPAWPEDWNTSFRLHAPYETVVEGRVEDGRIVELTVTPESRRKDVVVLE